MKEYIIIAPICSKILSVFMKMIELDFCLILNI
jgi:hypothetical protein